MTALPIPSHGATDSSAFYDRAYHAQRHRHLIADDEYFWARSEASANFYFTDAEQRSAILEYGCGIGQGIATLPNAFGWDPSEEAREHARARGVRVFERIDEIPRNRWDIVFCRHVLEHIEDPADALRTMRELVANTGFLYLILPKEPHRPTDLQPDHNQHLYCWNYRTIGNLLHRVGFEPYFARDFHVLGYRVLLPVRRALGKRCYAMACRFVGVAMRNGELVVKARRRLRQP